MFASHIASQIIHFVCGDVSWKLPHTSEGILFTDPQSRDNSHYPW